MDRVAELIAFVLGPCLFAVLVVGGFAAVVFKWGDLGLADYIGAVSAGAGLLTVGHGIHRVARSQGRTGERESRCRRSGCGPSGPNTTPTWTDSAVDSS